MNYFLKGLKYLKGHLPTFSRYDDETIQLMVTAMSGERIIELQKEIDEFVAQRSKEHDKVDFKSNDAYWQYEFINDKYRWAISVRGQQIRLLQTPVMKELPDYGDHMPIQEFRDACIAGGFISSDGHGYYASETQESDISIPPADCLCRNTRDDFTHVMWYNK